MRVNRIAIMQPYFFPYIGYFHLIQAADTFVIYDNLKYTKKGWINRNRFLQNGSDATFSIPLKQASDYSSIDQREIADDFDRAKLLNRVRSAYGKAPHFDTAFDLFKRAIEFPEANLFNFIRHSLGLVCDFLDLRTPVIESSTIPIDQTAKGQDKVIAICKSLRATMYINAIGGTSLYSPDVFAENQLTLRFIQSENRVYSQFDHPFVPWLSILDVIMFNERDAVIGFVRDGYSLLTHSAAA